MINDTIGERILAKLKDDILSGVYKPGDRLYYEKIASEHGVSMTPVKEALLRLEQEGIVKTIPRKGTYVTQLTDTDIVEYTRIRLALESLAVELICELKIPEEQIGRLESINRDLERAIEANEMNECMAKDLEFHYTIVELADSERLLELMKQLPLANFFAMRGTQDRMVSQGSAIVRNHAAIIKGLWAYDIEGTKASLKENILAPQLSIRHQETL